MRTRRFVPGTFVQSIVPTARIDIRYVGGPHDGPELPPAEVDRLCANQASAPFDVRTPPLFRAMLVTRGAADHLLLLTMPHLVGDAWSIEILLREFAAFYDSLVATGAPPPMPAAVQYPDYAMRQHDRLRTGGFDEPVRYWRERWDAVRSALISHADWPDVMAPAGMAGGNQTVRLDLEPNAVFSLRAYARRVRVPLYSACLATLGMALRACTGKPGVAVWINSHNRMSPGTDSMIGWLANSMIVGLDGTVGASGRDLLDAAHTTLTDAITYGDVPLAFYCNVLGHDIHFGDVPIGFERFVIGAPPAPAGGVEIVNERWHGKGRKNSIEFAVLERGESLALVAMYDAGQWSGVALERAVHCWHRCLEAMVENDGHVDFGRAAAVRAS